MKQSKYKKLSKKEWEDIAAQYYKTEENMITLFNKINGKVPLKIVKHMLRQRSMYGSLEIMLEERMYEEWNTTDRLFDNPLYSREMRL